MTSRIRERLAALEARIPNREGFVSLDFEAVAQRPRQFSELDQPDDEEIRAMVRAISTKET